MVDTVTIKEDLNPESPEYIAEMSAKGESAVTGIQPEATPVIEAKPEGIPDKFYNAETGVVDYTALAKSYVELEKSKGKPAEAPKTPPAEATKDEAKNVVENAGLDMSELSKQYAEDGSLSEANYEALAKAGINKATVDDYIEGVSARIELARTQAYSITEGAEGYSAMVEWAAANSTPEEIQEYNEAVNSKNPKTREAAIKGLWSTYNSESGNSSAELITNRTNAKIGDGTYGSRAEMMAEMNDPRYKTDEAYRKKVATKIGNSNIM
jgi:hypothetical protein